MNIIVILIMATKTAGIKQKWEVLTLKAKKEDSDFKASLEIKWLDNFKNRHGIQHNLSFNS